MIGISSALIAVLADGAVHSGTDLAKYLACSRTAVWKHLNELKSFGLVINAQRGIGYRLAQPIELLDETVIRSGLDARASSALQRLEIHGRIDSTNERLRNLPPPAANCFDAVLAEYQTGGRGRRGRQWWSAYGSGLCLSFGRWFENGLTALSALSLAVGVGVCRVLRNEVSPRVALKWPNDIVVDEGKLGGLLVDVQGEAVGPISLVVGFGLNFDVSSVMAAKVTGAGGLPAVGLRELVPESDLSRNRLAALLINELQVVLTEFERHGFDAFADEWRRYDWLANRAVIARIGDRSLSGWARGIADDGSLLIDNAGELQRLVSGEVSLRPGHGGKI